KQNKKKAVTFFGAVKVESIDNWNEGVLCKNGKNHNVSIRQKGETWASTKSLCVSNRKMIITFLNATQVL
ncbi:19359_t:CDS:2, partial [Gigaspora margarita]